VERSGAVTFLAVTSVKVVERDKRMDGKIDVICSRFQDKFTIAKATACSRSASEYIHHRSTNRKF